jgi:hypothetical protein
MLFIPNTHSYRNHISNVDHFLLSLGIVIDKDPAVCWFSQGLIQLCWMLVDLECRIEATISAYSGAYGT